MKTRYYIEGQEVLILRKHIEVCFSQDLSPFHFDFLTSMHDKLNSLTSSKFFISEKQSEVLYQIFINYIVEDKDATLGIFFKKAET